MGQGAHPEFDAFARAHMPTLLRFAHLLTGDARDAEDLLQASLVKVLLNWSKVCRADRPEHYVRRIMVNTHTSAMRRVGRRREVPVAVLPERAGPPGGGTEDRACLLIAMAALTRAQRAVVVLRFVEDRTEADAALILGVTVGTVKSQTHKALMRLRAHPALEEDRSRP